MSRGLGGGPLVVVGDSLLDVDLDGTAERLSPEAPVPVVDLNQRRQRPGGAALAALMAARSGQEVVLVTALAEDDPGRQLAGLLAGLEVVGMPLDGGTICKTRVRACGQPMLRIDSGTGRATDRPLSRRATEVLDTAGAVLVADYGRGVAAIPGLRAALARQTGRAPVVWDPHPRGADPAPGMTLLTPNASEAEGLAGNSTDPTGQGRLICRRWRADAVAVTVGERGALLSQQDTGTTTAVPPRQRDAAAAPTTLDTCGAGDQFAVAAAAALLAGATVLEATRAGVDAATRYVYDGGAAALSSTVFADSPLVAAGGSGSVDPTPAEVLALAEQVRRSGGRVVATGGCFDLLHPGHVSLLQRARELGDVLIVCLNSDASVRRAKGPYRPVVSQQDRARVLTALAAVDAVIIFDEDSPAEVLARLRPDVWVKGTDYAGAELPEEPVVRRHGGRVALLPTVAGYSTTHLVQTVRPDKRSFSGRPSTRTRDVCDGTAPTIP
ncbi:MAG: D-beta-D-heptose 7-phosphate kinase / D-beta-D-heptose 1-phosphate adenosyltransferase [Propionibacteriaceae bacterium]|nr:D-beta-D-heptose 7-phosphate kinase / D-beta-D-heptose 1-phosphate adenosyltransferase [Propionibacteriaceae bacterium]